MHARALAIGAALVAAATGGSIYHQRAALERRWVAYRQPEIEAHARAILLSGLGHSSKFVRIDSAGLLARLGDPQGFAVLERNARDPNVVARQSAVLRLGPFGERAFPILEDALQDSEAVVRDRAVLTLGQMQTPAATAFLDTLWTERPKVASEILLSALWLAAPAHTAELVTQELCQPRRLDRATALQAWAKHRHTTLERVGQPRRDTLDLAVDAVLATVEAGGGVEGHDATELRWRLASHIYIGEIRDVILNAPPAERHRVRAEFRAERLAELPPDTRDPHALETRLGVDDPAQRFVAAQAIWRAPTAAALAAADARLPRETTGRVRAALLRTLVENDPARAVPHLRTDVRHRQQSPRQTAVDLIKKHPHPALVPVYETALASEHAYVRYAAARALSNVQHADRRRLLWRALRDENADIQVQAAGGLLMPW